MLTVRGTVWKIFKAPAVTDKKTGEVIENDRVQIFGEIPLANGDSKSGLVELKCTDRVAAFEAALKKEVRCYVDQFHTGPDRGGLFLVKGSEIELVDAKGVKVGDADKLVPPTKGKAA